MAAEKDFFDITADAKSRIAKKYDEYYHKAKAASDNGELKLVHERIINPYDGSGWELKKGQVLRYELTHGPQIIDTCYLAKERPTREFADTWHSSAVGAATPYEGMVFFSNTPFMRPLLTFIKDTVDYAKMEEKYGEGTSHNFVFNGGRCTTGIWEAVWGMPHCNSCDSNMLKGFYEVAGEEIARGAATWSAFMHFQIVEFRAAIPTKLTMHPNGRFGEIFKKGDYVELLAHQDLICSVSTCPQGDQNDLSDYKNYTSYPLTLKIFEGKDKPLETAPDPQQQSWDPVDWIKAGRPGMVTGKIGEPQE